METYIWPFTNETLIRETELRKNPHYATLYVFWSKILFMEVIPYLTIIILNAFIIWKIVKSSKFRRNFTQRNNLQMNVYLPPQMLNASSSTATTSTTSSQRRNKLIQLRQHGVLDMEVNNRGECESVASTKNSTLSSMSTRSHQHVGKGHHDDLRTTHCQQFSAAERRKHCFQVIRFFQKFISSMFNIAK